MPEISMLYRNGDPARLLEALADNGAMTREELRAICKTPETWRKAIRMLVSRGCVREVVIITAPGRQELADYEADGPFRPDYAKRIERQI